MNTALKLAGLLGVSLLIAGCEIESTQAEEPPVSEKAAAANSAPTTIHLDQPVVADSAPAAKEATPPKNLSSRLQELLKMAERGLGDDVLIAWVRNSPTAFRPTPDEIVYLTDLGISEAVVKALIEHPGMVANVPTETAPPPAPTLAPNAAPSATITATPEFETAPQTPQAPVTYVQEPAPVQYDYFYSSLAPYGSWIEVADYGLCWRPTVAAVDVGWRPYCNRGRWAYSNCGWYWQSDYSWGWAPFHYGRWWNHPSCGWVWAPGTVWSPAWVTWRYSDSFCGWAPLPPGCGYSSSVGLTFHSAGVSVGFGFGLSHDCYTFVPTKHFHDRAPGHYALSRQQVVNVYNKTTAINNITHNSDNTLVNEGPGRDRIAKITRSEIQKVNLRDAPDSNPRILSSDRGGRGGKEISVYRPFNPTLPPEGSNSSVDRQEIMKKPVALSSPASVGLGQSSTRTIGSNRSAGSPVAPSASRLPATGSRGSSLANSASSAGTSGKAETLTEASLSKSALEDREARLSTGRRTLNNPVPAVRAPSSTPTVNSPGRGNESSPPPFARPSRPSPTIQSAPSDLGSRNGTPQPVTQSMINQRPQTTSRNSFNPPVPSTTPNSQYTYQAPARPAPAPATSTPSYRQEVTKPIVVSRPDSQGYYNYAPSPVTRVAPSSPPSYSPGASIQSVPYSGGPATAPQPARASPAYSAPRSAAPNSAPRAVTSQPSSGSRSSDGRSDRSSVR